MSRAANASTRAPPATPPPGTMPASRSGPREGGVGRSGPCLGGPVAAPRSARLGSPAPGASEAVAAGLARGTIAIRGVHRGDAAAAMPGGSPGGRVRPRAGGARPVGVGAAPRTSRLFEHQRAHVDGCDQLRQRITRRRAGRRPSRTGRAPAAAPAARARLERPAGRTTQLHRRPRRPRRCGTPSVADDVVVVVVAVVADHADASPTVVARLVWVTGPFAPGLATRMDTFTFVPPAGAPSLAQPQSQFQTHVRFAIADEIDAAQLGSESEFSSQFQFQTTALSLVSRGDTTGAGSAVTVGFGA